MNLKAKRCLLGLVATATMFGTAWAQDESAGTVRLGKASQASLQAPEAAVPEGAVPETAFESQVPSAPGTYSLTPLPQSNVGRAPGPVGPGSYFQMQSIDAIMTPRLIIDSRGGGLYGYNAGYSNVGAFVPYKLDDTAILYATGQGLITYDGRGGATVGAGWRYWMEDLDRIIGLAGFFDFDNGHAKPYQQFGLSIESLGRYTDYRLNGYIPVNQPDHVLSTALTGQSALMGNGIGLSRFSTVEQAFAGFDAEMGGPTPILGRYGLNAYIGAYYYQGQGQNGGQFTGVSGRLQSQINEDVSFGVQVTNDHMFGLNTQFQVFMNLPDGKSSHWFRNLRVQDRLVQNVFRQNRVVAKTESYTTFDAAINPETHLRYFVANIDPNKTTNGDGSVGNPFHSIAEYEALSLAQRQRYDIILVRPQTNGLASNLDTASTLNIYNGQRLLSTTVKQTFFTDNLPGREMVLGGFTGGAAPVLFNSSLGDVITLIGGNTRAEQVSGFEIVGSASGNGIRGNNNVSVQLTDNNIHGGLNGVYLTNLSGTATSASRFINNNIHNNIGNGLQISNLGSPPFVPPLGLLATGNTFSANGGDGMRLDANGGSTINGVIGGTNTATSTLANTFSGNGGNGLDITANGGTLGFNILNNTFTTNTLDGLHIQTTNNSVATFSVTNNTFGQASSTTSGNSRFGLGLVTDSGTTALLIGGSATTGNSFNYNSVSGIDLAASGTADLAYTIANNSIQNALIATTAAPHDAFTFTFNGTSGTAPFVITNLSDPGVSISSISWNLGGTIASIAPSPPTIVGINNPVVIQPINDNLLTAVNGVQIVPGSTPLLIAASNTNANNTGTGLLAGTKLIPLTFNGFLPNGTFSATSRFEQNSNGTALTSLATIGSTLTVNFSNGLQSIQKVTATPSTGFFAVAASGDAFGTSTPGFGNGTDGIHVSASGNSVLSNSVIDTNVVKGYGNYGIHVETSGNATASNVIISNNDVQQNGTGVRGGSATSFLGGGIDITRNDSSTLNSAVHDNTISNNFNYGLTIEDYGTTTGGMSVASYKNTIANNANSGLVVLTGGDAVLNFTTQGDTLTNNGGGTTNGSNVKFASSGNSIANLNLLGFVSNGGPGDGLAATSNDDSTMNLLIDISGTTGSSFSSNTLNGIILTSNERSLMHANVFNTTLNNNGQNGISYNRNGTSLILSNISNALINSNGANGIFFQGIGSDAQDPLQKLVGTANLINLSNVSVNNNGDVTGNTGDGVHLNIFGQSNLVVNATHSTFDSNIGNGLFANLTPGASFGNFGAGIRSNWDNVEINGNGANGILFTSQVSGSPLGDAQSRTYFDLNSVSGNTTVSNNAGNGIMVQYVGGIHDILVRGDGLATPAHITAIQNNTLDGIHADVGNFADTTISVDTVLIGGSTTGQGNKRDGISINSVMFIQLDPAARAGDPSTVGLAQYIHNYEHAGIATLNVNNSLIQNNAGNGIKLYGNDLLGDGFDPANIAQRFENYGGGGDGFGQLNATVTNSTIINNGLSGVSIQLLGRMGGDRWNFYGGPVGRYNNFTFAGNNISNNGNYGIFFDSNAAIQPLRRVAFFSPDPPNVQNYPLQPTDLSPRYGFNYALNAGGMIRDSFILSDWMELTTVSNSRLTVTNNRIQGNGLLHDLSNADGIKLRISTDSYLSADIQSNVMSGNVGSDFRTESYVQYNPVSGAVIVIPDSVHGSATSPSEATLDPTAQLDLRFINNTGNTINIVDPNTNTFGALLGSASGNGAIYPWEAQKDRFDTRPPGLVRLAQLFQLDNGVNVNSQNSFISQGVSQDLQTLFFNGDFHNRTSADPLFPNDAFPQDSFANPGNPFLP